MGESPEAEQPDKVEENLEPLPETNEPLHTIYEETGNKMEMPEARK